MALTLADKLDQSTVARAAIERSRDLSSVAVNAPSPGELANLGLNQLKLEGLVLPGINEPGDGAPNLNTGAFPGSGAVLNPPAKKATA